jgi:hypothetical protein
LIQKIEQLNKKRGIKSELGGGLVERWEKEKRSSFSKESWDEKKVVDSKEEEEERECKNEGEEEEAEDIEELKERQMEMGGESDEETQLYLKEERKLKKQLKEKKHSGTKTKRKLTGEEEEIGEDGWRNLKYPNNPKFIKYFKVPLLTNSSKLIHFIKGYQI